MKTKPIRLTEIDLHNIINESIKCIISDIMQEGYVPHINKNNVNENFFNKIKGWFNKGNKKDVDEGLTYYPLSYGNPDNFSCPSLKLKGGYRNGNAHPFFYYGKSQMGWVGMSGKCHTDSIEDMPKREDANEWLEELAAKKGVKSRVSMWKKMRSRREDEELVDGRIWMFETPVMMVWNIKNPQWMIDAAERLSRGLNFDKNNLLIGYGKRLYTYDSFVKKVNNGTTTNNTEYSEDAENLEKMKQAHLMNGEEKAKIYEPYLRSKYRNMGAKLTSDKGEEMSQAEYNALRRPYSESKKRNTLNSTNKKIYYS